MLKFASMLMAVVSLMAVGLQASSVLMYEFGFDIGLPPVLSAIFWPLYQIALAFFFFTLWQSLQRAEQPVRERPDA